MAIRVQNFHNFTASVGKKFIVNCESGVSFLLVIYT